MKLILPALQLASISGHVALSVFSIATRVVLRSRADVVILELKLTHRFPNGFGELVRGFNVMQCGAAKYVSSVNELGRRRLGADFAVREETSLLSNFRPGDDLPANAREDRGR